MTNSGCCLGLTAAPWLRFCCLLLIASQLTAIAGFILEGSKRSYVRYPKWYQAFENVLYLEFKTRKLNGLLLYTDDGGISSNFYELRLFSGELHLQFRLGSRSTDKDPANIIVLGKDLHDDKWHKVALYQFWEKIKLEIDKHVEVRTLQPQEDYLFGKYQTNSDVFIGGLPRLSVDHLSYKLVRQTEHFQGSIRNVIYRTFPHGQTAPHILDSAGVREFDDNYCEDAHKCRNNGVCYSTDTGPKCECMQTYFTGNFCERRKEPLEATFLGSEFIGYDLTLNKNGFLSREEEITLEFKTSRPNGLLFFSGGNQDYLHLALKDGCLVVKANQPIIASSSRPPLKAEPPLLSSLGVRVNDNKWHQITVHRKLSQLQASYFLTNNDRSMRNMDVLLNPNKRYSHLHLTVVIDEAHTDVRRATDHFGYLTAMVAYLGGKPATKLLPQGLEAAPFLGCIRHARYQADGRYLDFLEAAAGPRNESIIAFQGNLTFQCLDINIPEPITFGTSNAYLRIQSPWNKPAFGNLSFKIRTNEQNGLLLYNPGLLPHENARFGDQKNNNTTNFLALELLDGHLFLHISLGPNGYFIKQKISGNMLNDKRWHQITIERSGHVGLVTIDSDSQSFEAPNIANTLELSSSVFIGGLPWSRLTTSAEVFETANLPPSVWTASLRYGFVGCFKDLILGDDRIDFATLIADRTTGISDEVPKIGCEEQVPQCPSFPCQNGGSCAEGWNRFDCLCERSFHVGRACDKEPTVMKFEENQFVKLVLAQPQRLEAEDLSVRFQTSSPTGSLVGMISSTHVDKMELFLSNGQIELYINLRQGAKTYRLPQKLNDDQWHLVKVKRRARSLQLSIDQTTPVTVELPFENTIMEHDTLWAGRPETWSPHVRGFRGFRGQMTSFILNKQDVFQMAVADANKPSATAAYTTASIFTNASSAVGFAAAAAAANPPTMTDPVTFRTQHSFAALSPDLLKSLAENLLIEFEFRTLESDGLLLLAGEVLKPANEGQPLARLPLEHQEFLAVELHKGRIRYSFSVGNKTEVLQSVTLNLQNDFQWHTVRISRSSDVEHMLAVDGMPVTCQVYGQHSQTTPIRGQLYIGGIEKHQSKLPAVISSRNGFRGCLASLRISGAPINLLNEALRYTELDPGCEGPSKHCDATSCEHNGECVQDWESITCNCEMTTYSGQRCSEDSVSYHFGPQSGIISLQLSNNNADDGKHISTTHDALAIGIQTNQSDAIVLRVDSSRTADFLLVEILNGCIYVVYNLGDEDYTIGDSNLRINDNNYHVVQFVRSGRNSTFEIDNQGLHTIYPTGSRLEVFNFQNAIQLGGRLIPWEQKRRSLKGRVERPFQGMLSGVSFNRFRPLDLAAVNDSRISIEGDVRSKGAPSVRHLPAFKSSSNEYVPREPADLSDKMMQSAAQTVRTTTDELIISGDGSGCDPESGDGGEDCEIEEPSRSDLITPVIPAGRRKTTTTARPTPPTTLPTTTTTTTTRATTTTTTARTTTTTRRRLTPPPTTVTSTVRSTQPTTDFPDHQDVGSGDCQDDDGDGECDAPTFATVEVIAYYTPSTTSLTTTTARTTTPKRSTPKLTPPSTRRTTLPIPDVVRVTWPSSPNFTSSKHRTTERVSYTDYEEEQMPPTYRTRRPLPTTRREPLAPVTLEPPITSPKPGPATEAPVAPGNTSKTVIIATAAVVLIVLVGVVVCAVFRCRRKSSGSSCSTDRDSKSYEQLSSGDVQSPPQAPASIIANPIYANQLENGTAPLFGKVATINGNKRPGTKNNVKEWYV